MERLSFSRVIGVGRAGEPALIPLQRFVDGTEMLGFLRLDVKIERNEGPPFRTGMTEFSLDQGAEPLEKIRLKTRFVAVKDIGMSEHGTRDPGLRIGIPEEVLFDCDWNSLGQGADDAIGPLPFVGIAVMCVQSGACTRRQIRRGLRK